MTINLFTEKLLQGQQLIDQLLALNLQGCKIHIKSNSTELINKLSQYFDNCNVLDERPEQDAVADIDMIAIESIAPEMGVDYVDWAREPGKTGRKDEYFDFEHGRLVRKVRTGMVFLQSESSIVAAGPCIDNDNQVINFINSQYMNWLQNRGWLICHASGMSIETASDSRQGFAIAGLSGGGKSTLMLELMNHQSVSYVTNDRLFINRQESTQMLGIAKLPRINPGTIVGNPRLHLLLDKQQLAYYQAMPSKELWHVEEKNDVPIETVYGPDRLHYDAELKTFIILNWHRDSEQETSLKLVNLEQNREFLKAIMKSPGPFYQQLDGRFQKDNDEFDEQAYIDNLSDVKIYQATGKIDFKKMSHLILSTFSVK